MTPDEARTAIQRISDNEHQALVLLDENAQLLDRLVAWLDAVSDPPLRGDRDWLRLLPGDAS